MLRKYREWKQKNEYARDIYNYSGIIGLKLFSYIAEIIVLILYIVFRGKEE